MLLPPGKRLKIYATQSISIVSFLALEVRDSSVSLYQDVFLNSGNILSGWAAFDWDDMFPFVDGASVDILQGGNFIATPWSESGAGHPDSWDGPWTSWSWTAPSSGTYRLQYTVKNTLKTRQ